MLLNGWPSGSRLASKPLGEGSGLTVGRRFTAILTASLLAVLTVASFLRIVWISPSIRQAIVWIDLLSPSFLMDAAALLAVGTAYARLRRLAGWEEGTEEVRRGARDPLVPLPLLGLLGACSAVLFIVPIIHVWVALPSLYYSIGGLLPYSDAFNYYDGATRLLTLGHLDEWNSRRPVNAMLLAVRLALAGHDLRWALLIQAGLLGFSCFLMARAIAREFGAAAGLMLFACLYAVAREYVRSTMSESLGLTIGVLASTILWIGARRRERSLAALGMLLMTVALNARSGAFLTLPALIAWAAFAFRRDGQRVDWRSAAIATGAVAAGFLLNAAFLRIYAGTLGVGNGNFALTLYGFSTGRPGWTRIYADLPQAMQLSGDAQNHFAYVHALENIRAHPAALVRGLWIGMEQWSAAIWLYVRAILSLVPYPSLLNAVFQVSIGAGICVRLWRFRKDPAAWLLVATTAGFFGSGAVVFPDAGFRALAVSYPLFVLVAALGIATSAPDADTMEPAPASWPAITLSAVLILLALGGPAVAHRFEPSHLVAPVDRTATEDDAIVVRVGPGTPHLDILAPGSDEPTFLRESAMKTS